MLCMVSTVATTHAMIQKSDPNLQDNAGLTSLMHAILNDNTVAALELIHNPTINLDLQDKTGKTALIYSVKQKNNIITELLLKQNANINVCDTFNASALLYDITQDQSSTRILLQLGAHLKLPNKVKISSYVRDDHFQDMIKLLEHYYACYNDSKKIMPFLQKHKKSIEFIFTLAALNDHQTTLDCLVATPKDMLAILERCIKWNRSGATAYALKKLIALDVISSTFAEEKQSFDERSCCCSLFCWPCFCWSMYQKNPYEKFLLTKDTTFRVSAPNTERHFEMAFKATIYKKAFTDFFKTYNNRTNEKTLLLKTE